MNLHVSLPRAAFLHGESIPVDCVLERSAQAPIRMPDPELNDGETRYVLVREGAGAAPTVLTGSEFKQLRQKGFLNLSQYEEQPAHFRRAWRSDLLLYTAPPPVGEYALHVEFAVDGESAASTPVRFRVDPARPVSGRFDWFPQVGPRGSWEGAWVHHGAPANRLIAQAGVAENPRVVERGLDLGDIGAGAGEPQLAARFRRPIMTQWRWVLWLDGQTLHGRKAPAIAGEQPQGALQGTVEETQAWLVTRPIQGEDDGLLVCVAGERGGRPVAHTYHADAHGALRAGEAVELPFLPSKPHDLARVALDAAGERAALLLVDRTSQDHVRLLRHDVGPSPGSHGWNTLGDFHGSLIAWGWEDPGAGDLRVTVLVEDGGRWGCGTFPLSMPSPWKQESLAPLLQVADGAAHPQPFRDSQVREAAVAAGLRGEPPLVVIFDRDGALWATSPAQPPTLSRVRLPHLAHGAQHLVPCVTAGGRRYAGFVENEVGWRWERLFRQEQRALPDQPGRGEQPGQPVPGGRPGRP